MVTFPTVDMRKQAVQIGIFVLDQNSHVQLAEWKPCMGMAYDPASHKARLRLYGVPREKWNIDDLDQLLSGIGHVVKMAPVIVNGNYETVRVLLQCHNPAQISPSLLLSTHPYSTVAIIELKGWLHTPTGHLPPGGGEGWLHNEERNNRYAPPSPDRRSPESSDYSRTISDTYHRGVDSAYSRTTRSEIHCNRATMAKLEPMFEKSNGDEAEFQTQTMVTLVDREKKRKEGLSNLVPPRIRCQCFCTRSKARKRIPLSQCLGCFLKTLKLTHLVAHGPCF